MINPINTIKDMKNIYILIAVFATAILSVSCNDEWAEEQYEHYIGFRSPLNDQGVTEIYVPYSRKNIEGEYVAGGEGRSNYELPVIVSGSLTNQQNITVHVAHDADTLKDYNFERFRNRTALYYVLPSEKMYSFPAGPEITIKSGSDYAVFPLTLNLKEFDLYSNYILPLQIENVSTYQMAWSKYTKLLMRLNVSNFFSGNYNVDGRVWEESYPDQKLPISSTVLRALTADQCYLYAGNVTDSDEDRAGYSLTVKVDKNSYEDSVNDETGAEIRKYTVVTIGSKNADKNIKDESNGKSWVEISRTADPVNNNLENVVTKVYLHYSYMNLRDAEYPVKMIFEGTLTRSESIDIRTEEEATSH